MTPDQFWSVYIRFCSGTLSPTETAYYRAAGLLAESQAREQGSSLLPYCWQGREQPPETLPSEQLIAIGLTALALSRVGA